MCRGYVAEIGMADEHSSSLPIIAELTRHYVMSGCLQRTWVEPRHGIRHERHTAESASGVAAAVRWPHTA